MLLEVVARGQTRESTSLLNEIVSICVECLDFSCGNIIANGTLVELLVWRVLKATDCYVNDNVSDIVNNLKTLINSRGKVSIPNSATVHKNVAFEVLRGKHGRNRS